MASWQAHALSFFLRLRFKRQLAAAQDVAQVRRVMNQMPAGQPRGVHCSPWVGGGIQGEPSRAAARNGQVEQHRPRIS
jgi:hypothetical protein